MRCRKGARAVPIGKARIARAGADVTVITYAERWCGRRLPAAEQVSPDISTEVIDLRSLKPLDREAILASVRKTGRAVVVHSANRMGGIGAEIAAELGRTRLRVPGRSHPPAGWPRRAGSLQPVVGGRLPPRRSPDRSGDTPVGFAF